MLTNGFKLIGQTCDFLYINQDTYVIHSIKFPIHPCLCHNDKLLSYAYQWGSYHWSFLNIYFFMHTFSIFGLN